MAQNLLDLFIPHPDRMCQFVFDVLHCQGRFATSAATKGVIVAFTRSLSQQVVECGNLVNAVAPLPVWTPLIPASFEAQAVAHFGEKVPLGRAGQPDEIAPSYVFLASGDSSYILHVGTAAASERR